MHLEEYNNKKKYARYYKAIIAEPSQGGYTYRLWKNRFVSFYDDVELNEWSNNRMYFEGGPTLKDNMGTALWYAMSLAEQLVFIGKPFVVCLDYQDNRAINSRLYKLKLQDSVKVTFFRRGAFADNPNGLLKQVFDNTQNENCRFIICV